MNPKERKSHKHYAPLLLLASFFMIIFCSILNVTKVQSMDLAFSLIPFFLVCILYTVVVYRLGKG